MAKIFLELKRIQRKIWAIAKKDVTLQVEKLTDVGLIREPKNRRK